MLIELERTFKTQDILIEKLQRMSHEFFFKTGWDQGLFEQVHASLHNTFYGSNCELYTPFIKILQEGIYTTLNTEDFTKSILSWCEDSFTSLRCMCVILERALEKLHMFLAI